MRLGQKKLRGKRIAILAADGFEYVELALPMAALRSAGAEVEVLSLHGGKIRGMNLTEPTRKVRVDRTLDEADPDAYDALLIPGGFVGPDFMRQSREARDFVRAFDAADKPIATLCHGPWLLVSAELVEGRRLASWPSLRDDIVHAGGVWRDEALVHDRNWVSSRGPQDMDRFLPAMLELFSSGSSLSAGNGSPHGELASSPKYDRPLSAALTAARVLPGPGAWALMAGVLATALGVFALKRLAASA